MKAYLCGRWDGANLWLQWEDVAPETGYRLRVRGFAANPDEWHLVGGLRKPWLALPMHGALHATKDELGATIEAQVAVDVPEPEWVPCAEVTFARSRCLFEFRAGPRGLHYQKGTEFHCIVDAAAAHYRLLEEIELAEGESIEVEMEASSLTGYCQLDRPDHFVYRPGLGSVIRNVAPSVDDVTETGRMLTQLEVGPREPVKVAFGKRLF